MKSVFYITFLTLLFSLNIFSQEKTQAIVLPVNLTSEHLQNIYQSDLDVFGEFKTTDLRTTINKTLLGNGFLLIEEIYQNWDGSAWVNVSKNSYTYDLNNNQTELLLQIWQSSTWLNWEKSLFTYDVNNNQSEELYQQWNGFAWVNNDKSSYTYDANNNLTEVLGQYWEDSVWKIHFKSSYTYDGNNNLTEWLYQNWDGSTWVNNNKYSYTYDGNNNLTEWLLQGWDGSAWLNIYKYSYTYDGNNNPTELLLQIRYGSAWVNVSKNSCTYDTNNNKTEELYQQWNDSAWVNWEKYSYSYAPITALDENLSSLNSYSLSNNYPNPFNPSTKITYTIPERSNVSLKVFDLLGSEVVELVNGEIETGTYDITFNAANLPSGIYFYQLKTENYIETKKMILLK